MDMNQNLHYYEESGPGRAGGAGADTWFSGGEGEGLACCDSGKAGAGARHVARRSAARLPSGTSTAGSDVDMASTLPHTAPAHVYCGLTSPLWTCAATITDDA